MTPTPARTQEVCSYIWLKISKSISGRMPSVRESPVEWEIICLEDFWISSRIASPKRALTMRSFIPMEPRSFDVLREHDLGLDALHLDALKRQPESVERVI